MLQSGAISCLRIVEKEKLHFRASGEVFFSVVIRTPVLGR
jgi:hypothetical protein